MKSVYPVFLTQTNTMILVDVPDLEILTEGKDIPDAINMARDAIELKCVSLEDEGIKIPQPSDIATLNVNAGTFAEEGKTIVSLVDVDPAEYRRKIDTKTVRRNVALPSWLNYEAEQAGVNVSRILQEALISTLNLERRI
ncbi:MAG: type II toxin-antitoxin system HicB family antitoxin [Acetatifactor sp.]|nr:type II toxin-antitoxin system HicB family antitoxin [Acetatifactor sp.]